MPFMIYFLALVTRIVLPFPEKRKVIFIYLALGSFRRKLQSDRKKGRKHKEMRKPENVFIFSERNFFFLLSSIFLFFGEKLLFFFPLLCAGKNTLFIILIILLSLLMSLFLHSRRHLCFSHFSHSLSLMLFSICKYFNYAHCVVQTH